MKFKIYDYDNKATEIDVGNKIIDHIRVLVLSGDEVVRVFFENGKNEVFDSSNYRVISLYEGQYEIHKSKLFKWVSYQPNPEDGAVAYQRFKNFS